MQDRIKAEEHSFASIASVSIIMIAAALVSMFLAL
jgi:hypothetical protein